MPLTLLTSLWAWFIISSLLSLMIWGDAVLQSSSSCSGYSCTSPSYYWLCPVLPNEFLVASELGVWWLSLKSGEGRRNYNYLLMKPVWVIKLSTPLCNLTSICLNFNRCSLIFDLCVNLMSLHISNGRFCFLSLEFVQNLTLIRCSRRL